MSGAFRVANEALSTMPIYNVYGGLSVNEFALLRQQWVVDTKAKIDAKVFVTQVVLWLKVNREKLTKLVFCEYRRSWK